MSDAIKKLDFLLLGMPRSGTSATARYLSAMEGVFCGQEVFPVTLDHSALAMPEAFLEPQHPRWNDSAVEEVSRRKDEIRVWGNKTPTYFNGLERLRKELDDCPLVVCLRDPLAVARSYSTRATNEKDPWASWRHGIFAVGDTLVLSQVLASARDPEQILLLPHSELVKDWQSAMGRVAQHIAPKNEMKFRSEAIDEINKIKKRQTNRKKVELAPVEMNAIRRIERTGLSDFFNDCGIVTLDMVQSELDEIVKKGPPHPISFIRRLCQEHPVPEVVDRAENWLKTTSRTLKRVRNEQAAA